MVAGAVVVSERFTSADPETGAEAFLSGPVALDKQALFGQAAWSITEQLRLVLVGRSDWSSLHSAQLSPKASLIYSFVPDQSVRFTYNRAFQSPNVAEFFLEFPVAPPAPLGGLNAFCTPFGVDCGFGDTPILARGNADLDAETIRTWEVGYKGVLPGGRF